MAVLTATGCSGSAILSPRGVGIAGFSPHAVPVSSALTSPALQAAAPQLRVTLLDLDPADALPDDSRLLVVAVKNGRLAAVSPDLDALGLSTQLGTAIEVQGADLNGNGVPDGLEAALGAPLRDGMEILIVRKQGDYAVPEAPFLGTVVTGATVPVESLPASWVLTPRKP